MSAINSAALRVQIVERPTATTSARDFEPRSLHQFLSHGFFASNSKSFPPPQLAACCETGGVLCILTLYGSSGISRLRSDLCEQRGFPLEDSFLLFAMASRIISLLQRCTQNLISRLLRTQDTKAFQFSHLTLEATKDLYFQTEHRSQQCFLHVVLQSKTAQLLSLQEASRHVL